MRLRSTHVAHRPATMSNLSRRILNLPPFARQKIIFDILSGGGGTRSMLRREAEDTNQILLAAARDGDEMQRLWPPAPLHTLSSDDFTLFIFSDIQRSAKRYANLAKQDPGRARQSR